MNIKAKTLLGLQNTVNPNSASSCFSAASRLVFSATDTVFAKCAKVLLLSTVCFILAACSGSSSGGGSGDSGGVVTVNLDGTPLVFPMEEQRSFEILPSVAIGTADIVDWRFDSTPSRMGALSECAGRDGFDLGLAVNSLTQACSIAAQCSFDFDQSEILDATGNIAQRFVVEVPVLRAPVGLVFGLDGTTSLDESVQSEATFCLIPINDPPIAEDDAYTVVQGETLNITPASPLNLLSNDVDDIDTSNLPLRVSTTPIAPPQVASVFELRADGGFTYRFDGDVQAQGSDRLNDVFTYQVSDGVNTSTAEVRVTVVTSDDPPIQISGIPAHTAIAGIPTEFDFSGNFQDPEGSQLVFTVVDGTLPPASELDVSVLGVLSGVAASEDVGSFAVAVTAADSANSVAANFLLNVVENQPVQFTQPGSIAVEFGQLINIDISANVQDPEGQPINYTLSTDPASPLSINAQTGLISGTLGESGDFVVTVTADDGFTAPSSVSFTITQQAQPNRAPVFTADIGNQGVTIGDTIASVNPQFTDLDGDQLTFGISSLPAGLSFSTTTGQLSGTPTELGIFGLSITATDTEGAVTNSNNFTITVVSLPNEAPTLQSDLANQSGTVGEAITPFSADFVDPEGEALSFSATGLPAGLSINTSTGEISGTPTAAGTFVASIAAEDSIGATTESNSFLIIVAAPVNQAPVFSGTVASQNVTAGTALLPISGTFTDPEGDALTFSASGLPANVSINSATGVISGTPTAIGSSTIVITATDSAGNSVSSNAFTVSVTAIPNNPPVVSGSIADQAGVVGTAVTPLALASFFSDTDQGDSLTIALASNASLPAGLSINAAGTISGTPTAAGTTSLVAVATDEDGASVSSNSFDYVISLANVAPNITSRTPAGTVTLTDGETETIDISVTDESLTTVVYTIMSSDTDVVDVSSVADDEYLLEATGTGTAIVTIVATDTEGLSDAETIPVTVQAIANVAPNISTRVPAGASLSIDSGDTQAVTITVVDEDIASLVYTATTSDATVATVTSDGAGAYTVTAVATGNTSAETATITLLVEDNGSLTDSETFTVVVPAIAVVNQAPVIVSRTPAADPITSLLVDDTDPIEFVVTDEDVATLTLTALSSDPTIVSVDDIDDSTLTVFLEGQSGGTATITVTVTDADGLSDQTEFDVTVSVANAGPATNGAIPDQQFEQGTLITPIDTSLIFTDADGDVLTFSVDQLPDGLALDPATGEISGTPLTVETVAVTVSATDAGGSNTTTDAAVFDIDITDPAVVPVPNSPPVASATPQPDVSVAAGIVFSLDIGSLFTDADNDVLAFSVDQLPGGLALDAVTGLIEGTPTATVLEQVLVTVSATDTLGSNTTVDAAPFEIEVLPVGPVVNLPPVFNGSLSDLSLVMDTAIAPIDFSTFFNDPESDVVTFSADQLPVGLVLDATTGVLSGTPSMVETLQVIVSATDTGSGSFTDAPGFEIDVL